MTGAMRGAVPGQLSLLELPELLGRPNDLHGVTDAHGELVEPADVAGLGEWERTLLRFAAAHHLTGEYADRVQQELGCGATRYLQALAGLLDRPEALAVEPELVGAARAQRDRRQRLRVLGRGSR